MNLQFLEYAEYLDFFSARISKLRTAKKISAREMSLSLSQSKGYITAIERKQSLPSMFVFLKICDYLDISPRDFFDDEVEYPETLGKLIANLQTLNRQELESVVGIVDVIVRQKG
ncbi:MAG: helix-turn-helix transcriptional regulator [Defluviitaleaceae bacterium]|nr:helix-turn-helix transcriptional regulator [Defluviitaleaceae bacterium]